MAHLIIWNSFNHPSSAGNGHIIRPLGAHQIAAWISKFGYSVKVVDFCGAMTEKDLIAITEKHLDERTIAIGASTTFWRREEPHWLAGPRRTIEARYPRVDWILGGQGRIDGPSEFSWKRFLGHAEDELLAYLDARVDDRTLRPKFDIKTSSEHFLDGSGISKDEVLPIELGRGCQFKCGFCRYPLLGKAKGTYIRDYPLVESIFRSNYERFGTTRYMFMDDTLNESEEKIVALAGIAKRLPFRLEWVGYNRLDLIGASPRTARILQESGLRSAFFGIESFHPQASRIAGKGWNGKHAKDFLLRLRDEWKERTTWSLGFIVGLGDETSGEIDRTHQWCIDNGMYSWGFEPLDIFPANELAWKSEFDLRHDRYGYSFPDRNRPRHWKNKHWNSETAAAKASALNSGRPFRDKIAVWELATLASAGYAFDRLMKRHIIEFDMSLHEARTRKLVADYVAHQLALV